MNSRPFASLPANASGYFSLQDWRARILSRLLQGITLLATVVAVPSVILAALNGMALIAGFDTVACTMLWVLWRYRALSFSQRAWGLCAVVYLTGTASSSFWARTARFT